MNCQQQQIKFQIEVNSWINVGECFQNHWSLLKHHHRLALPSFVFASQCLTELQSRFLLTGVTIFARLKATGGARHRRHVSVWRRWWQGSHRGVEKSSSLTELTCGESDCRHTLTVRFLNYGTEIMELRSLKGKLVGNVRFSCITLWSI